MSVGSRPMGARVSVDGRVVGETPMVLTDLTPGEHQIGLDLDAKRYQPWSSSVVVTAGHEEKLLAVMTPKERRGELSIIIPLASLTTQIANAIRHAGETLLSGPQADARLDRVADNP